MSSEQRPATVVTLPGAAGTALLEELSQITVATMAPMLDAMFAACDDFFFDLASRARSNNEQTLYFESLREIRQKKSAVIEEFGRHMARAYNTISSRTPPRPRSAAAGPEPLKLIAQEQIEREVLITDMVTRARSEWQEEFFQLNERMGAIAPRSFEEKENPLDPEQIARSFVRACEPVDVELKILKLLYRQFDRHVLRDLEELFHLLNQRLIEAQVLPGLSPLARRKVRRYELPDESAKKPEPEPPKPEQVPSGIPDSDPEMRELGHLLRRLRSGGVRMPMFPQLPPETSGPPIGRDELITLLSDVQLQPGEEGEGSGEGGPVDIRRAIEAIIANRGHLRVGQADEDVINVVAMFFDLILDDRTLPLEIQALVSRLQIPILKVALRDRTFFTERKHPARALINEIARTSIGWEASSKDAQDALYSRLSALVELVLRSDTDHTEVFEKCLTELSGFIERNEQRAAKIERRTGERAQAEARTARARDMVRHVLQERLEGKELPTAVTAFLVEDWQRVLQLVYLRQGKDSPEWIDVVQTVDDLVWSVQQHEDDKSRARRERLLPDLYRRMTSGLEQTQSNAEQAKARIDVIRELHGHLGTGQWESTVQLAPLTPAQQEQITPVISTEEKSWRDMTAVERQKVQYEALMYEYLKRVDDLSVGTWFEYDDLRRAVTRRCKLSTRVDESRTFIFVNRFGMQVFEKPRKAFAYDLQMGHARLIEDAPLFDRTIERISANLRKLTGDS